ncbi:S-adenosyl-L-methionine-dependent methyltransferase, partial [Amniculicola lignicola CBS 123094]
EGDVVLLRDKKDAGHEGILVRLKKPTDAVSTHRGNIAHADILGKHARQIVQTTKHTQYRIHEPTLADYVRLTPRIVTPIYPSDANLIVSLLDIHVDTCSPGAEKTPPLEILEAGTGHGALTLHLARAVHAANPAVPAMPPHTSCHEDSEGSEDDVSLGESMSDLHASNLESWKASRGAIVHTLDISSKHTKHAKKIVEGFRHGMYARDIDFHVGDVSAWIAEQHRSRKTEDPFLSCIFLDLPNANTHLANVASALRVDGMLAVFNPSITQIGDCVETIREQRLPYLLDQVVELGVGTIRQWDVRSVKPRATVKMVEEAERPASDTESSTPVEATDAARGQGARDDELAEGVAASQLEEKRVMVCRPKVGDRVVGGGFLGLWRRMEQVERPSTS